MMLKIEGRAGAQHQRERPATGIGLLWFSRTLSKHDHLVGMDVVPALSGPVGPLHEDAPDARALAKAEVHTNIAGAQVARIGVHSAPERRLAIPQKRDARTDARAIAFDPFETHLEPVMPRADFIVQEPNRAVVVGHEDVNRAVVVEIAERCAPRNVARLERPASDI